VSEEKRVEFEVVNEKITTFRNGVEVGFPKVGGNSIYRIADALAPDEELFHDDDTMSLVAGALIRSGLNDQQVSDAINSMQNAGILFREWLKKDSRSELIEKGRNREA
jgi:hypothetical protein